MLSRPLVARGPMNDKIQTGDILSSGESIATLTTAGAGTILGAAIAAGILRRTGPAGGFTDTFDTAANILTALAGGFPQADAVQGLSFRWLYINGVAQAMTAAAPSNGGVILGTNVDVAASAIREYLITINNATPPSTLQANTTNASAAVTLVTPILLGTNDPTKGYGVITPGMSVYGTNIPASTTVIGVTQGQGTITGFTLSQNATGTGSNLAITLTPTITIAGLRAGTA